MILNKLNEAKNDENNADKLSNKEIMNCGGFQ